MYALHIHHRKADTSIACIFEIDEKSGAASVADIIEFDRDTQEFQACDIFQEFWGERARAVKVELSDEIIGIEPCGNHYIVKPELNDVWSVAFTLAEEID